MPKSRRKPRVSTSVIVTLGISVLTVSLVTLYIASVPRTPKFNIHDFANAQVAPAIHLGIMSDSSSDEYRANDNRAGSTIYAPTTLSWGELLQRYRGVDLGLWGTRAEPRRTGFEYNWARSGATARTLITSGEHTGIASQVRAGLINVVYLSIGNNDFAYYADGAKIYDGTISGTTLTTKINNYVSDVTTALDTVRGAGNVQIVLTSLGDPNLSPYWTSRFPDATKRARLTSAINQANAGLVSLLPSRPNVTFLDLGTFASALFAKIDPATGALNVNGEMIVFSPSGDEPHHAILGDNIHTGTVGGGILANTILAKINQVLGSQVPLFSDAEVVMMAGIGAQATPAPTLVPTLAPTPVVTPTPTLPPTITPSTIPLPTLSPTPTPIPTAKPSPSASPSTTQQSLVHIVTVPNSTNARYTIIDGIVEAGKLVEVTSPRFVFSKNWSGSAVGVNNSAVRYADRANEYVDFKTTEKTITIQTARYSMIGSFDIYVNGTFIQRYNGEGAGPVFENVTVRW